MDLNKFIVKSLYKPYPSGQWVPITPRNIFLSAKELIEEEKERHKLSEKTWCAIEKSVDDIIKLGYCGPTHLDAILSIIYSASKKSD